MTDALPDELVLEIGHQFIGLVAVNVSLGHSTAMETMRYVHTQPGESIVADFLKGQLDPVVQDALVVDGLARLTAKLVP